METYVVGKIDANTAGQGSITGIMERLEPVGYEFKTGSRSYEFTKPGRIESVITELVPVCEDHGLDVEEFELTEYRRSDGSVRGAYRQGRITRQGQDSP